ncbi:MAG: leucine-rich repeat domain-containing protein, partial [Cytophagia bacterium]|nr:leucine-rich repeat domain-containing protein [Cytophagia bacterium]
LNCSGTNVKRFRGLEGLQNLREIDCSNTKVFKFDRLTDLKKLEKITCFNTGLRQNDIDKLLESLPDVEVVFY